MNLLSLFSFLLSILAILQGISVLRIDHKSGTHRIYFLLSLLFWIWSFSYTFLYPAQDINHAWLWYRISSIGWIIIPAVFFLFTLHLTQYIHRIPKWIVPVLFILPAVMLIRSMTGIFFASDFIISESNRTILEVVTITPWFFAYIIYNAGFLISGTVIVWLWGRRSPIKRERDQAWTIIWGGMIAILISYSFNVFPALFPKLHIPVMGHFGVSIYIIAIGYAVNRYKMMRLTLEIAANNIIDKMDNMLFLLDSNGKIIMTNPAVEHILGYKNERVINRHLGNIIYEASIFNDILSHTLSRQLHAHGLEFKFIHNDRYHIPVHLNCSIMEDHAGDSIGYVVVAQDIRQMLELANERYQLQQRNDIIEQELVLARNIQIQQIPDTPPHPDVSFYYQPMDKIGGDFFDFIPFDNPDKIGIFLSDVSGHGVPAAFITSTLKNALFQFRNRKDDPAKLLTALNETIYNQSGGNFVTAFYGIYNFTTRELTYSIAGHNLPYIVSDGKIEQLPRGHRGVPLGTFFNFELEELEKPYLNDNVTLPENSKLLIYTDGLIDVVHNERINEAFEDKRLEEVLIELESMPARTYLYHLFRELITFHGSNAFEDDICMVLVDVKPDPNTPSLEQVKERALAGE